MTIALAAYGPDAGKAVAQGLLAAELLGRGSIGGFAVFSALDAHGAHLQMSCQNGGVTALANRAELYPVRCAAVISSGPNRPEPLSQFLAGQSGVGLVTGHRLPNRVGRGGEPVNLAVLGLLAQGLAPSEAVHAVIGANPELDAGLIAMKADGPLAFGNTGRVNRRHDLLTASRQDGDVGYALLCNSIYTARNIRLEEVVGDLIWSQLTGETAPYVIAGINRPASVIPAESDRVDLDEECQVIQVQAAEPSITQKTARTTVIHLGAPVWQAGRCIGRAATEVLTSLSDGQIGPETVLPVHFLVERVQHVAS